jgi:hypothetical protein
MKSIFESEETFTAYATIDAGYYMIQDIQKKMDKPLSPVEKAIDEATGYDKVRLKKHIEQIQICLIDIIEAKKIIEADYSKDHKLFTKLQTLKNG